MKKELEEKLIKAITPLVENIVKAEKQNLNETKRSSTMGFDYSTEKALEDFENDFDNLLEEYAKRFNKIENSIIDPKIQKKYHNQIQELIRSISTETAKRVFA